jgi:hypothetical protein
MCVLVAFVVNLLSISRLENGETTPWPAKKIAVHRIVRLLLATLTILLLRYIKRKQKLSFAVITRGNHLRYAS